MKLKPVNVRGEMHRHVTGRRRSTPGGLAQRNTPRRTPNCAATRRAIDVNCHQLILQERLLGQYCRDRLGDRAGHGPEWLVDGATGPAVKLTLRPSMASWLLLERASQCEAGNPAFEGTIAIGCLGQRFDRLGLECHPLLGGMLENMAAPMRVLARRSALPGPP